MELVAVEKIQVDMPEGPKDLEPGDRLFLPDRVGQRLLELAPGRVRVVEELPFQINAQVIYTIPDPRSTSRCSAWLEHTGKVRQVDPVGEMVFIEPEGEPETPWMWVWWGYCRKVDDGQAA